MTEKLFLQICTIHDNSDNYDSKTFETNFQKKKFSKYFSHQNNLHLTLKKKKIFLSWSQKS